MIEYFNQAETIEVDLSAFVEAYEACEADEYYETCEYHE